MSQVDYCLNVPGISRVHAQIEKSDSQVMLMDVGSTNGTYVNGRRLPANQKEEIHHGDVVSFAGEEYYCL
jgi:pSer/pThr/pTyr-binding forkhead associated (FHA) protein